MGTTLSESQHRCWAENGFLVSDLLIDPALLEEMRAGFDRVFSRRWAREAPMVITWDPGDRTDCVRKAAFSWRVDPVLEYSALIPEIGRIAAELSDTPEIRLLMDWIVHKPGIGNAANPQTGVGFHQDLPYWGEAGSRLLLTARIPLDRETSRNGCMRVVPGSHRMGIAEGLGNGFWSMGDDAQKLAESRRLPPVLDCELEPGQVMFHHCLLLHASGQNRTGEPRRSQNIHMMPADTHYVSGMATFFQDYAALHHRRLEDGGPFDDELFPRYVPRRPSVAPVKPFELRASA